MKQSIAIAITLIFFSPHLFAQNNQARLDQYFTALANNGQFNGNILVAEKGKVIYQQSFGMADFAAGMPNDLNTVFPIASLSKTFTATAILQLAQAGKLQVTDAVIKYLPAFPYPSITIQQLLSHTSGLPPYNAYFDSTRKLHPDLVFTNADFMPGITSNTKPLIYQPGDKGNYDNINFIVLALLIEKLSGITYSDYITRHILRPAGMTHTFFMPLRSQYTAPAPFPFAYPHLFPHRYSDSLVKAKAVPYILDYWSAYNFSGFGDYASTMHDLLLYDKAYYGNKLLEKATIAQAFIPVKLNSGAINPSYFGHGWEVAKDSSSGKLVYHNGNATGHSCILLRNISKHQTVIIFDNIHTNNSQDLAFKAMSILNGVAMPLPKKSIADSYVRVLLKDGPEVADKALKTMQADTLHYYLSEDEMNVIGYDLMGGASNPNPYHFPEEHKYTEALEVFRQNTVLFPGGWNTHDSYGEILLFMGRKEAAIKEYQRSVELNPNSKGGRKILEELLK